MTLSSKHMLLAQFLARPITMGGVAVLIVVIFSAVLAPLLAPFDPHEINPTNRLMPPNAVHWFGTDQFGRDTLSRTIYAARMALLVGVGVVVFSLSIGVPIGILSAIFPRVGNILMRAVDVLMAFPSLLLALGLIVILGPSVLNSIIAVGAGFLTNTTRIVYGITLRLRSEIYIDAARSMGAPTSWLVVRHILPNLVSPLLVQASFVFAFSQLAAASLDFLGVGAPPDIPSWGNMLAESRHFITRAAWLLFFPGGMIVFCALSLNLVGDALRDQLDPRLRSAMGGEA
jgi:peptide/nickel transport system permease protein